jgi:hypothetical protein
MRLAQAEGFTRRLLVAVLMALTLSSVGFAVTRVHANEALGCCGNGVCNFILALTATATKVASCGDAVTAPEPTTSSGFSPDHGTDQIAHETRNGYARGRMCGRDDRPMVRGRTGHCQGRGGALADYPHSGGTVRPRGSSHRNGRVVVRRDRSQPCGCAAATEESGARLRGQVPSLRRSPSTVGTSMGDAAGVRRGPVDSLDGADVPKGVRQRLTERGIDSFVRKVTSKTRFRIKTGIEVVPTSILSWLITR